MIILSAEDPARDLLLPGSRFARIALTPSAMAAGATSTICRETRRSYECHERVMLVIENGADLAELSLQISQQPAPRHDVRAP
jgi:hypothetical protein